MKHNIKTRLGKSNKACHVNDAAEKYFVGNAQLLRKLEAIEKVLKDNIKIILPSGSEIVNVIGKMAGVLPLTK